MNPLLLDVRELQASYGRARILHGLTFTIQQASITTLLGANGAGKTTTLRALCGLVRTRGEIRLNGLRIDGCNTEDIARLGVAHVPQERGTFTRMTVEENLLLGAMTRTDKPSIRADVERMCAYFPVLKKRARQQAGTLSGGEQQMLAIARALMLRPRLMLLDEPSFGLAPLIVQELFEILALINRDERVGILLVEQNASLALRVAQHAYLLETGRIVLSGPSAELLEHAAVRQAYLGE